jgi:hypothetical protein
MTYPLVVFPDAELVVAVGLRDVLPTLGESCPVLMMIPDPRPATFVIVRRVGGVRGSMVTDRALLAIEAWGDDPGDAQGLAQLCRAAVHSLRGEVVDGVTVYGVTEVAGPGNLPDPESTQARYTMTVQVGLRGSTPAGS